MGVVRRIQEDPRSRCREDHGVVFRDGRPYVRLLHKDGEAHSVIIVSHLGPGLEVRGWRLSPSISTKSLVQGIAPHSRESFLSISDRSGAFVANIRRRIERWLRHIA